MAYPPTITVALDPDDTLKMLHLITTNIVAMTDRLDDIERRLKRVETTVALRLGE